MSATDLVYKAVYRMSGGRLGHRAGSRFVLLLTSRGRRSGKPRTTPLVYMPVSPETPFVRLGGERGFLIAGSNWGGPRDPAWLLNLDAQAEAEIQAGPRRFAVRARRLEPDEAEGVWPEACRYNDHWAGYREHCTREIPLVLLTPVD